MRTVRHPIAMFVTAVLAVIAIGVGVVAATTNQTIYGPSWGRFSAAFMGHVYVQSSAYQARHTTSFIYANQPWSGWVAYSALGIAAPPGLRSVIVTEGVTPTQSMSALRRLAEGEQRLLAPGHTNVTQANGFTVVTIGPQCANGPCQAEMVVSNGRVVWDLLASNGSASAVEGFLDSFQPIG
jgi:hypothetical protein